MMKWGNILHFASLLFSIICNFKSLVATTGGGEGSASDKKKPVNILLILADDLGYGDLSVQPFTGSEIKTPYLEKMASNGLVMTNFHTAAATCSPTRVSILTGIYPWRLGVKSVFEYGAKGNSNRDDWLIQVPTIASIFRDSNYSTFHSGKWHVSGMRSDDLDRRRLAPPPVVVSDSNSKLAASVRGEMGRRSCHHPGPNQQGFQEYVSLLDGPSSPRQNILQVTKTLYHHGCQHLVHNDNLITAEYNAKHFNNIKGVLTSCEAQHGIRMMNASVAQHKPFYLQVWFHAPHGPWEEIPGYTGGGLNMSGQPTDPLTIKQLPWCDTGPSDRLQLRYCRYLDDPLKVRDNFASVEHKEYRSIVSHMDKQIGLMLDSLKQLGVENNTLVVFMSDNGPELFRGTTGGLRGNKRDVYEGGIRVPAIFQWPGTIPAGMQLNTFGLSTDLLPTFLEAAQIELPPFLRIDGVSLLPELLQPQFFGGIASTLLAAKKSSCSPEQLTKISSSKASSSFNQVKERALATAARKFSSYPNPLNTYCSKSNVDTIPVFMSETADSARTEKRVQARREEILDRITLWHNDYEGPKRTSAVLYNYKVILNAKNELLEMFDLLADPLELINLIENITEIKTTPHTVIHNQLIGRSLYAGSFSSKRVAYRNSKEKEAPASSWSSSSSFPMIGKSKQQSVLTREELLTNRINADYHKIVAQCVSRVLVDWSQHGNEAYKLYMSKHRSNIAYVASHFSDIRMVDPAYFEKMKKSEIEEQRQQLLRGNTCLSSLCDCELKQSSNIELVPFHMVHSSRKYMAPRGFANASLIFTH